MPKIKLTIDHGLDKSKAIARIQGLLEDIKDQFGDMVSELSEEWNGNKAKFSFKVKGFSVSGNLTVNCSNVQLNGKLPMAAGLFRGKIEKLITERAKELLS